MPPHSKTLSEEGATFKSFKLVEGGIFREEELIKELMAPGNIPGCSGSRNLHDNLSDLRAQVAANQKVRNPEFREIKNREDLALPPKFPVSVPRFGCDISTRLGCDTDTKILCVRESDTDVSTSFSGVTNVRHRH